MAPDISHAKSLTGKPQLNPADATGQRGNLNRNHTMELTQSQKAEALARVSQKPDGWYVQLDLHGNDMDGPHESEDEAIERAMEAMQDGEITGSIT